VVKEPVSLETSKGNGEESCLGDLVTDEHFPHRAGAVNPDPKKETVKNELSLS